MFDLKRIPIVRALFPYAGGAGAGLGMLRMDVIPDPDLLLWQVKLVVAISGICLLLLVFFRRRAGTPRYRGYLFFLFAFPLFFISGLASSLVSSPHDPGLPLGQKMLICGDITEGPHPGRTSWSYGMHVRMVACGDSVFRLKTHLKVHIRFLPSPESVLQLPGAGETWQFYGHLQPIRNSGNPGAPDYAAIMGRKNCWYRFYPDSYPDPKVGRGLPGLKLPAEKRLHTHRIRKAVSYYWKGREADISLLKAVCLGDRSELTDDLKLAYSHAGAMHLLAVSGLHLGLIWWVLYRLFAWITRITGKELYRSVLLIGILWMFAFVSGFSSSVSRAACMFTLFTAGRLMDQRMHSMNGILVSAFLMILIRPQVMLHVGFQLSYMAILGIAGYYPACKSLFRIKNLMLRRIWEAGLVSLSAQLSTAALVIHYFHQIPIYSLLSSLLTVPLLSLLISLFVISVPFAVSGVACTFFNAVLVKLAGFMNFLVGFIASLPGAVVDGLNMDTWNLCLWMLTLITGMLLLHQRVPYPRYLLILLVSVHVCSASVSRCRKVYSSEMVVCHFYNASLLSFRERNRVDFYVICEDSSAYSVMETYIAKNWSRRDFQSSIIHLQGRMEGGTGRSGSVSACCPVVPGIWILGNDHHRGWLISGGADQDNHGSWSHLSGTYRIAGCSFVLLSHHPAPWNMPGDLLCGSGPVILDGSNPRWYSAQLERFRQENSLFFEGYRTWEHGAYVKRW